MKLIRLKILTEFRGLAKNFEIIFSKEPSSKHCLEPICFVGLNGSGKSNVMEALSEIFYFLETYHRATKEEIKKGKFNKEFGFDIEYTLNLNTFGMSGVEWNELTSVWSKGNEDPVFRIIKRPNELPQITAMLSGKQYALLNNDYNRNIGVLPHRIIGYSSGMNELISNAFIKMDFQYFEDFQKKSVDSSNATLDINRTFFMDYESNQLITLCNFLFDKMDSEDSKSLYGKNLNPIKKELQITRIFFFTIKIQFSRTGRNRIKIPSEINLAIDWLKRCASCVNDFSGNNDAIVCLELFYWVNDATKQAFRKHFKSADQLYRNLYFLRLLNHSLVSKKLRIRIISAEKGDNISALLPKFEADKQIFGIKEIAFRKKGVVSPVYYRRLSDGEHQLLHVVGTIILMDAPGTLYLLDEPETHFNPEWRSKFVCLLNECLNSDFSEQEVLLTSHSPFIVSDCKPHKVYSFKRNRNNNVVYEQPEFNTFGASVNLINSKVFGKRETISGIAQKKILNIQEKLDQKKINKTEARREIEGLGDSIEKVIMLNKLK